MVVVYSRYMIGPKLHEVGLYIARFSIAGQFPPVQRRVSATAVGIAYSAKGRNRLIRSAAVVCVGRSA